MSALRNWRHEKFAQEISAGTDGEQAYAIVGFKPHRANWRRLMRRPNVAARIEELQQTREAEARAARVPADHVLEQFNRCGVELLADFFERDAAGILRTRDLRAVPVEVSIALLRSLREALGILNGSP